MEKIIILIVKVLMLGYMIFLGICLLIAIMHNLKEKESKENSINARDLFIKLGFKCIESVTHSDEFIWYQKNEKWGSGEKRTDIIFDAIEKRMSANTLFYNDHHQLLKEEQDFDLSIIQAIHKQIEELDWVVEDI